MTLPERCQLLLDYWLGRSDRNEPPDEAHLKLWWGKDEGADAFIKAEYGADHERARRGELVEWTGHPRGQLALIIVLDQFSRVLYRGSSKAFAQDSIARAVCKEGLAQGQDRSLSIHGRAFYYMPLMHSEDLEDHDLAVRCFEHLVKDAPEGLIPECENFLRFEHKHRDIIAEFGRYPHRNEVLGRTSTKAERAFLKKPGSSF